MCMYQFLRVGYNLGIEWERVSEGPNSVHEDRNFVKFYLIFVIQELCTESTWYYKCFPVLRKCERVGRGKGNMWYAASNNAAFSVVSLIKNKNAVCITTDTESTMFV